MTTRNVALDEVIGGLVAAGSLVAAPVAKADLPPTWECEPGCWGAIAASHSTGQVEDPSQLQRTRKRGRSSCLVVQRPWQDERLPASSHRLRMAVSRSRGAATGKRSRGQVAPALDAADAAALDAAGPGSKIDLHDCNDYNGPRGTPS